MTDSTDTDATDATDAGQVRTLATSYFEAWQAGDEERLRTVFADDATFVGPMGTADGVDACVAGLLGLRRMMNGLEIELMLTGDADVMTWYRLKTDAGELPTVNWSHVTDGRISAVRATFDPRPLLS